MLSFLQTILKKEKENRKQNNATPMSSFAFLTLEVSMNITIAALILVTTKGYIGDNIRCITGAEDATPKREHVHKAVETYCYILSHFTAVNVTSAMTPHPGVYSALANSGDDESLQRQHAYYQWVPFVLMLQAFLYYLPLYLWRVYDSGYFNNLVYGMDSLLKEDGPKRIRETASYFGRSLGCHGRYALTFTAVEVLSVSASVGNLFLTNAFLGGHFLSFGPQVLRLLVSRGKEAGNLLDDVFPKVTKCTWRRFGPSGSLETHDALCVLPMNVVNEKTYVILWAVFVLAAVACTTVLLAHGTLFLAPTLRARLLVFLAHSDSSKNDLSLILPKCDYGDWFILYQMRFSLVFFDKWISQVKEEIMK